jgi:predicted Rossmann-fold nucleotide-binding protein
MSGNSGRECTRRLDEKVRKEAQMNKDQGAALAKWLLRLPGASALPFRVDRRGLYRISDLYKGYDQRKPESWARAFDHTVYAWTLDSNTSKPRQLEAQEVFAERLHDVAIGRAIDHFLSSSTKTSGMPVVGFMGGHDARRDDSSFREVAAIARTLRKSGYTIVSGGGPGLMEAANFGAFMAPYTDAQFEEALGTLRQCPVTSDPAAWVGSACKVRQTLLENWKARENPGSESLGIPTWYYGNEPPNLFASHTGKYFFNSVREDGLVSIANGGIVFGPGKAGTVQEVFQDAPLNFYRKKGTRPTPMVLLGAKFWNPAQRDAAPAPGDDNPPKPVWPLLLALASQAKDNNFADALKLTDSPDEVITFIVDFHASTAAKSPNWAKRSERLKGRATAAL